MNAAILIPCRDEVQALPQVFSAIPPGYRVVLCDNGSVDGSVAFARAAGVEVTQEPRPGYGGALLAGIQLLRADPPDLVVILDGDASVDLADLPALVDPIRSGAADLVIGERLTRATPGALTLPQRLGNRLASSLIARRTGVRYRDLGPFRAIRWSTLEGLDMEDLTWGWNVEMQLKAARRGVRFREVPVAALPRVGRSKISGTWSGVVRAGVRIVWACWRYDSPEGPRRNSP